MVTKMANSIMIKHLIIHNKATEKAVKKGKMMKRASLALALVAVSGFGNAQEIKYQPVLGMKGQFGGDTLEVIPYTDGTSQDLNAGQGINFYGGMLATRAPYSVKATIGYKYSSSMASDIDVAKTAMPFELTARYNLANKVYFGGGLTQHFNPKLTIDDDSREYDASPGFHLEAGWGPISLGWTSMTYTYDSTDFDASSFDVNLELLF